MTRSGTVGEMMYIPWFWREQCPADSNELVMEEMNESMLDEVMGTWGPGLG